MDSWVRITAYLKNTGKSDIRGEFPSHLSFQKFILWPFPATRWWNCENSSHSLYIYFHTPTSYGSSDNFGLQWFSVPCLAIIISIHKLCSSCLYLHGRFIRRYLLCKAKPFMPKSPSLLGNMTLSHLTRWICAYCYFLSKGNPFLCYQVFAGLAKNGVERHIISWKRYLAHSWWVNLSPIDKYCSCLEARLFSNFCMTPLQMPSVLNLALRGFPK